MSSVVIDTKKDVVDTVSTGKTPVVAYCPGVFDIFHSGHRHLLNRVKGACDRMVVGVHTDKFVAAYKRSPTESEDVRRARVAQELGIPLEDCPLVGGEHKALIVEFGVNRIYHGDDWEIESYKRQIGFVRDGLDKLGVEVMILPYTKGISTSIILAGSVRDIRKYNSFLFDLDKTLMLGNVAMRGAVKVVQTLQGMGKEVWCTSNNNYRSPLEIEARLNAVEIMIPEQRIMTSLVHVKNACLTLGRIFVWGTPASKAWLHDSGVTIVEADGAIDCVVLLYRSDYAYADMVALCNIVKRVGKYIVGNCDLTYPHPTDILPDTGALAELVRKATGKDPHKVCGKPSTEMMPRGLEHPALMIGDSRLTDMPFAEACGMDFVHVDQDDNMATISHLEVMMDWLDFTKTAFTTSR